MSTDRKTIHEAIGVQLQARQRLQRMRSVEQRLADFAALQEASFRVLCASPEGYRHFLRRNLTSRRVEVIDGKWRPVSAARRAQLP
jgi:hypothetical protein